MAVRTEGGRYLASKRSGQVVAQEGRRDEERNRFHMAFTNRSSLALRCDQGYVGVKTSLGSARIECNRTNHEIIRVTTN